MDAIKVKPLEWREARASDRWERFTAESILGRYEVLEWSNGGFGGTLAPQPGEDNGLEFTAANMGDAKTIAQADYERRILSAIEP
jgi:hypothetical protein